MMHHAARVNREIGDDTVLSDVGPNGVLSLAEMVKKERRGKGPGRFGEIIT